MEYVIICLVALLGSALTFFSGFGLATLLVPVFAVFFPIDVAIGLTAIVHFLNNLFKLLLVGRNADRGVALRFGLPALLAAFAGAWVLTLLTGMQPLHEYELWDRHAAITPVKLTVAVLLAAFALIDLVPSLSAISFSRRYLPVGGLLSGFFGGLSGNQGALRSAFLIRIGLSKEAFIATGVVIAVMVDVARLSVYSQKIFAGSSSDIPLVAAATLSAFAGAYWGNKLLKKVTISALQVMVGVLLLVFALMLGAGVI
ncbi:MAG: sulfite exporter TauE/SafE family protein [Flavipsychrobacter sp.]|nr:sulfite exporter TauE/SafE family protein [Flavipsychrobacter sp.]